MNDKNNINDLSTRLAKYERFVEEFWEDLIRDDHAGLDFMDENDLMDTIKERFWHFRAEMAE